MTSQAEGVRLASVLDEVRKLESGVLEHNTRISFLRNFTIEGIEPFLKLPLLKSGINPEIQFGDFDVLHQEILNPSSRLHQFSPEIVVLSLVLEIFDPASKKLGWTSDAVIVRLKELYEILGSSTHAVIGLNTFLPPFVSELGITHVSGAVDKTFEIGKINQFIREFVRNHSARYFLSDWERVARQLGEEASMDYRFWYMSKAPFKKTFLNLYAGEISKTAKALKGKSKKCLILDCDNTLWGGIIGEDGVDGIQLNPHTYPGNVFFDFQLSVLSLYERGIVLAINSKNNAEDVWQVFDTHPDCLLKRSHFAAERINWKDKASNILSLAEELNLGLDSFVFVDDNPVECELIRKIHPTVTVLQVPSPIHNYPTLLLKDGLFDGLSTSSEDKSRTQMYRAEKERISVKENSKNIEEYLSGLEMRVTIHEVTTTEVGRVAQLSQKTNQFNLTTRRYTEGQIELFTKDSNTRVFSLAVKDKFGDLGLTGVLIARKEDDHCIIDSMLMSCRILGRSLEIGFVNHCLERLDHLWHPKHWNAEFIATKKNQQTRDFWKIFGFIETNVSEDCTKYFLAAKDRVPKIIPFLSIQE